MAVLGGGCVRVRLVFDYPPPGTSECCMCWLLVDAKRCRVVADLSTIIRQKFGFSGRSVLSLFVDDYLLPPSESIMLVRDNDCIRVKLEEIKVEDSVVENYNDFGPSKKSRKRQRPKSEDESEHAEEQHRKKKKIKQKSEAASALHLNSVHGQKKRMKRKTKERNAKTSTTEEEDSGSHEQTKNVKRKSAKEMDSVSKIKRVKGADEGQMLVQPSSKNAPLNPTKGNAVKKSFSENGKQKAKSDSSIWSPDIDLKKSSKRCKVATAKKDQFCPNSSPANKITVTPNTGKAASSVTRRKTENTSSDSDSSTEDDGSRAKKNCVSVNNHSPVRNSVAQPQREKSLSSSVDYDSSHSNTSVTKSQKPGPPSPSSEGNQGLVGNGDAQFTNNTPAPKPQGYGWGKGRGRGDLFPCRGSRGYGDRRGMRGRGRGQTNHFFYDYNGESLKFQQINEVVANSSVVIQNPPDIPKKDYSVLPLLAAPPQAGEKIAFKLLELTENYTPEVSDYKEGKILSYSPVTHQVDLEIISSSPVVKEPGKFDLVYQTEDGTDMIEFAVSQDTKISKRWDALIEPRLIVETSSDQAESTEPMKT
uniref:Coilin n=1 Tax=Geotrypetes seraphini TaxID=260995 RepID=A0A6P8SBC1_GEOSA|nr:coilin [Geotrypetes seraphini]